MREAYASDDDDFGAREPARGKSRRPRALGRLLRFIRHAADYPNRVAGTILIGLVIAICVNALVLQRTRHPAPLFRKTLVWQVSSQSPKPRPTLARAQQSDPIARLLGASAARNGATASEAREAGTTKPARDAISQLLASEAPRSAAETRTVLAAQRALVKLGFVLKPDGIVGAATRQAIAQFEHDRGLPARGELTPKILRELSAQSGVSVE